MVVTMEDRRWYRAAKGDAHQALKTAVDETLTAERPRIREQIEILRLFRQRMGSFVGYGLHLRGLDSRVSRNVLRSIAKTIQSRLVGMKAIPFFCSDGGDIELRSRLELLNAAVAGLFTSTAFEDKYAPLWCLHGILVGTGFVHAYADKVKGTACVERVYPWEVLVDPVDGLYGEPRTMYRLRWIDRPVLREMFPGSRYDAAIKGATVEQPDWARWTSGLGAPVRVIEAWHLPDDEGQGGRHILATTAGTLVDEEYTYDDFPIVAFQYSDPEEGYWPDGVGQSLYSRQLEINRIAEAIRETIRRLAWPRVLNPQGSQVSEQQLDNTIGAIIEHAPGLPPQIVAPPPLTRDPVQYLSDLVASCYEDEGVSQMAAQAQKPAGIVSGRGLRIVADQQDGRLRDPGEKWTHARCRLGKALVRAQREASKAKPKAVLLFTDPKARSTTSVVWNEIDLPDKGLEMTAQPVSSLPQTPASKAALLEELYNGGSGVITLEEYRDGIDLPDVTALTEPSKAPRRTIEKILDAIVQTGVYTPPEAFFPLEMGRTLGAQRYCQAFNDDAPPEILALLRRWCLDCKDQQDRMAPPPTTPQPPGPMPGEMPLDPSMMPPPEAPPEMMP